MVTTHIRHGIGLLLFVVGVLLGQVAAAAPSVPPAPTSPVTDRAGMLSPAVQASLAERLTAYECQSGNQVVVWIGRSLEGDALETFAVRAFEAWGVGREGKDNGVALFVFAEDRKLRIEVGYGLEDRVTDLMASKIIGDVITPELRAGNADAAIVRGVEAIVDTIEGRAGALPRGPPTGVSAQRPEPREISIAELIVYAVLGVGFLILLITNPGLALALLFVLGRGGRGGFGGGGFGGGGGWGGGGGRSGGGGASGGW